MRTAGTKSRLYPEPEIDEATPGCDHPDCAQPGPYRAPKGRDRLNDYFNFCLDHVRDYNKSWNYFDGMGPDEIENQIRRDTVWDRPTWRLGSWPSLGRDRIAEALHRSFGFEFGGRKKPEETHAPGADQAQKTGTAEIEALKLLDLAPPVAWVEVKARYKALAKRLHPDANGGDKEAEERLKLINQAYSTLKSSLTV